MSDTTAREHALLTVKERGWHVFRLAIGHDEGACDGGTANCKTIRPLDRSWAAASTADPDVVAAWDWSRANAYGIDCGKSAIFVVDVDPEGEWAGPETRVHSTGRGEHHVFDDLLGLPSGQAVWPHVDTRGVGGMVVGPGSWHPHGAYAVARDIEPAPVPADVVARVHRSAPRAPAAYAGPAYEELSPDQRERADRHADADLFNWSVRLGVAADWPEGHRDDRGRGWELLARDFAWWCSIREASPYLPPEDGQALFEETMPPAMLANAKCRKAVNVLKAADHVPLPPWLDPVFDATPTLRHIRQAAHARTLSARAMLVCVLCRVAVEAPRRTALPAVVGSRKALNLGAALVGASGGGKSAVFSASRELLGLAGEAQRDLERVPGSGEGLIQSFLDAKQNLIPDPARLFFVDEIQQLGASKDNRSGSTLGPVLRSLLTGEMLGTENADRARRRHVPEGAYRAALVAGVQPAASDVLLNEFDAMVGTPQRFVWAATADPAVAALDGDVEWPGPLDWRPPAWPDDVEYPEHVRAEVRRQARAAHRPDDGEGDARIDGHARLTRLKVAALLAFLHGEAEITDLWWRLAGEVVGWSDEAVASCRAALGRVGARKDEAQGRARGRQRLAEESVVEADRRDREAVARQVLAAAEEAGDEGATWSSVRNRVRSSRRAIADLLVGTPVEPGPLVESGQLRLEAFTYRGQDGVRVHRGS